MVITNFLNPTYADGIKAARRENAASKAESSEGGASFSKIFADRRANCPYGYMAKDGLIEYNGVVFVCDVKTNSICLGDMTNPKKVLNISLPSGGNLKVNINNFGDISKSAGMFSPEDLNAILRAIAQYNHCTGKLDEIEQQENEVMDVAQNHDKQEKSHDTQNDFI